MLSSAPQTLCSGRGSRHSGVVLAGMRRSEMGAFFRSGVRYRRLSSVHLTDLCSDIMVAARSVSFSPEMAMMRYPSAQAQVLHAVAFPY